MNMLATPVNAEVLPLSEQEQRLIKALRLLTAILPDAADQVEYHLWGLVGQHMNWSYDDPESIRRTLPFAALDPYLKRESDAITAEFGCTEGDGLEGL
jgi:hypothetical protein